MPLIVPTPWDTKRLRRINVCLAAWKTDADPRALSEAATKALEESEFRNQWIARRGAKNLTSVKDLMALILQSMPKGERRTLCGYKSKPHRL